MSSLSTQSIAPMNPLTTGNSQFDHLLAEAAGVLQHRIAEVQSFYELELAAATAFKGYHESGCQDDFGNDLAADDGASSRNYSWYQRWLIATSTYGGFDWPRASCSCIV